MKKIKRIIISLYAIIFIIVINLSIAYTVDPPDETVHQHITNESQKVWKLISSNFKNLEGGES